MIKVMDVVDSGKGVGVFMPVFDIKREITHFEYRMNFLFEMQKNSPEIFKYFLEFSNHNILSLFVLGKLQYSEEIKDLYR